MAEVARGCHAEGEGVHVHGDGGLRSAAVVGLAALPNLVADVGADDGVILAGGDAGQHVGQVGGEALQGGAVGKRHLHLGLLGLAGGEVDDAAVVVQEGVGHVPHRVGGDVYGVAGLAAGRPRADVLDGPVHGEGQAGHAVGRGGHVEHNQVGGRGHGDGNGPGGEVVPLGGVLVEVVAAIAFQQQVECAAAPTGQDDAGGDGVGPARVQAAGMLGAGELGVGGVVERVGGEVDAIVPVAGGGRTGVGDRPDEREGLPGEAGRGRVDRGGLEVGPRADADGDGHGGKVVGALVILHSFAAVGQHKEEVIALNAVGEGYAGGVAVGSPGAQRAALPDVAQPGVAGGVEVLVGGEVDGVHPRGGVGGESAGVGDLPTDGHGRAGVGAGGGGEIAQEQVGGRTSGNGQRCSAAEQVVFGVALFVHGIGGVGDDVDVVVARRQPRQENDGAGLGVTLAGAEGGGTVVGAQGYELTRVPGGVGGNPDGILPEGGGRGGAGVHHCPREGEGQGGGPGRVAGGTAHPQVGRVGEGDGDGPCRNVVIFGGVLEDGIAGVGNGVQVVEAANAVGQDDGVSQRITGAGGQLAKMAIGLELGGSGAVKGGVAGEVEVVGPVGFKGGAAALVGNGPVHSDGRAGVGGGGGSEGGDDQVGRAQVDGDGHGGLVVIVGGELEDLIGGIGPEVQVVGAGAVFGNQHRGLVGVGRAGWQSLQRGGDVPGAEMDGVGQVEHRVGGKVNAVLPVVLKRRARAVVGHLPVDGHVGGRVGGCGGGEAGHFQIGRRAEGDVDEGRRRAGVVVFKDFLEDQVGDVGDDEQVVVAVDGLGQDAFPGGGGGVSGGQRAAMVTGEEQGVGGGIQGVVGGEVRSVGPFGVHALQAFAGVHYPVVSHPGAVAPLHPFQVGGFGAALIGHGPTEQNLRAGEGAGRGVDGGNLQVGQGRQHEIGGAAAAPGIVVLVQFAHDAGVVGQHKNVEVAGQVARHREGGGLGVTFAGVEVGRIEGLTEIDGSERVVHGAGRQVHPVVPVGDGGAALAVVEHYPVHFNGGAGNARGRGVDGAHLQVGPGLHGEVPLRAGVLAEGVAGNHPPVEGDADGQVAWRVVERLGEIGGGGQVRFRLALRPQVQVVGGGIVRPPAEHAVRLDVDLAVFRGWVGGHERRGGGAGGRGS